MAMVGPPTYPAPARGIAKRVNSERGLRAEALSPARAWCGAPSRPAHAPPDEQGRWLQHAAPTCNRSISSDGARRISARRAPSSARQKLGVVGRISIWPRHTGAELSPRSRAPRCAVVRRTDACDLHSMSVRRRKRGWRQSPTKICSFCQCVTATRTMVRYGWTEFRTKVRSF